MLRTQSNGRTVECNHNLKVASDPFMGLNSGLNSLRVSCVSQSYVLCRQRNLDVLIAEVVEQTGQPVAGSQSCLAQPQG